MNLMHWVVQINENKCWMDQVHVGKCIELNWKLIKDAKNIDKIGGWPGDCFYL